MGICRELVSSRHAHECYFVYADSYRENAWDVVDEYYESLGGKDNVWGAKAKAKEPKKKRGRPSKSATPDTLARTNGSKKRKEKHPAAGTPPPKIAELKLPQGNWEDQIKSIDTIERTEDDGLEVMVSWKDGNLTRHPIGQLYKRAPQKVGLLSKFKNVIY
jgi:chromobox protein 1